MSDSFLGTAFKLGACALVGGFVVSEMIFEASRRDDLKRIDDRDFLLRMLDQSVQSKNLEGTERAMVRLLDRHGTDRDAQLGIIVAFRNIVDVWPPGPYLTTLANKVAAHAANTNLGQPLQMMTDKFGEYWPLPKPKEPKPKVEKPVPQRSNLKLVYSRD